MKGTAMQLNFVESNGTERTVTVSEVRIGSQSGEITIKGRKKGLRLSSPRPAVMTLAAESKIIFVKEAASC